MHLKKSIQLYILEMFKCVFSNPFPSRIVLCGRSAHVLLCITFLFSLVSSVPSPSCGPSGSRSLCISSYIYKRSAHACVSVYIMEFGGGSHKVRLFLRRVAGFIGPLWPWIKKKKETKERRPQRGARTSFI